MTTDERFRGDITLVAYALGLQRSRTNDDTDVSGSHTVFFPHDSELRLNAHLSKTTYRPGEEADADFRITSPDQSATRSAIGLVVVDKAVSERERTDHDFGPNSGFYSFRSYWDGDDEFAGLRRADLNKVDMSKPLPDGLNLPQKFCFRPIITCCAFQTVRTSRQTYAKSSKKRLTPYCGRPSKR